FVAPQAQRVDRCEIGPEAEFVDGADELSHLIDGEHVGQAFLLLNADSLESGPVAGHGVGVEEFDGAVGDAQCAGGGLLVVLEMEEVVADLLFAQAVRWRVVVDCELPYDAKVGPLSALAKTGELKVLVHLLAECGGHDKFLGQRVKNQPLRGNMRHGSSGCQGVPNRPEFREAATTLRAQCETLDQPAALAAYLNPCFWGRKGSGSGLLTVSDPGLI